MTLFVFFLAVGTVIHKTQLWEGLSSPFPILTTGLTIALLFKPESPRVLLAFAVATLAEATWYAPFYFLNHMVFVAFVAIGIIGANLTVYAKEKRLALSVGELESYLFPLLRAGVYATFALVLLHKLNKGFLDPMVSCAVQHWAALYRRVPFLPDLAELDAHVPILMALLVESSIPVLLFIRRTRQLGLIVALGFHYAMGINGFQGYSGYAWSIYIPFLPHEFHHDVAVFLKALRCRFLGRLLCWSVLLGFDVFAVGMTLAHAAERTYQIARIGYLMHLLLAPLIAYIYLWLIWRHRLRPPPLWPTGMLTATWQAILLVLFVGHGLSPYLGLKTQAVFSMYSNLQTEKDRWNHLFLPESLRIAGFQNSLVTVTAVEGMTLLRPWERDFLQSRVRNADVFIITEFELKRQIAAHCRVGQGPIALSFTKDGQRFSMFDACSDPTLRAGNIGLLEKVFWFRPVYDSSSSCIH